MPPSSSLSSLTRTDRTSTTTGPGGGHATEAPKPPPSGTATQQSTGSGALHRLGAIRRQSRAKPSGDAKANGHGRARGESSSVSDGAHSAPMSSQMAALLGAQADGDEAKPPPLPERPTASQAQSNTAPAQAQTPPTSTQASPPPIPQRPQRSPPMVPIATRPTTSPGTPPPIPTATRPNTSPGTPPPIPMATRPTTSPGTPPPVPTATRPTVASDTPPPLPARPPAPQATASAEQSAAPPSTPSATATAAAEAAAMAADGEFPTHPPDNSDHWASQLLGAAESGEHGGASQVHNLLQLLGARPLSDANAGRVSIPELHEPDRPPVTAKAIDALSQTIASMQPGSLSGRDAQAIIGAARHVMPVELRGVLLGNMAKLLSRVDSRSAHQAAFRAISDQIPLLPPEHRMQVIGGLAEHAFHPSADSAATKQDGLANMNAVMTHLAHVPPEARSMRDTARTLDLMAGWLPNMMADLPPHQWQPVMNQVTQQASRLPPSEAAFVRRTLGKTVDMTQPGQPLHGIVSLDALLLMLPDHLKPHRESDD